MWLGSNPQVRLGEERVSGHQFLIPAPDGAAIGHKQGGFGGVVYVINCNAVYDVNSVAVKPRFDAILTVTVRLMLRKHRAIVRIVTKFWAKRNNLVA